MGNTRNPTSKPGGITTLELSSLAEEVDMVNTSQCIHSTHKDFEGAMSVVTTVSQLISARRHSRRAVEAGGLAVTHVKPIGAIDGVPEGPHLAQSPLAAELVGW